VTPADVEVIALALPGAELSIKWGDHRTFCVGGKMFAILSGPSGPLELSFKCSDMAFELLIERDGIIPAPYLQRAKWVRLETLDVMDADELTARIKEAHRIVAGKLPKTLRPAGM
jgi:predicted DNA-binding protein (MmcQ/YjbR family)